MVEVMGIEIFRVDFESAEFCRVGMTWPAVSSPLTEGSEFLAVITVGPAQWQDFRGHRG